MACKWCGVGKRVTRRLCAPCFELSKQGVTKASVQEQYLKKVEEAYATRQTAYAEYVKKRQQTKRPVKSRIAWELDRVFPQRHNHPYASPSGAGTPPRDTKAFADAVLQRSTPIDWRSFK
jgi:hypothetical protein